VTLEARIVKFDDSEVFSTALKQVDLEIVQTGRGAFTATLANFVTGSCDVQLGTVSQPIFARGANHPQRLGFLIELQKGRDWSWFGQPMRDGAVGVCAARCEFLIKAAAGTQWVFISVRHDILEECADTIYGRDLPYPRAA
jgi:hypothetical protein